MIRAKIFEEHVVEHEIEKFIADNKITREQIISFSFACDSNARERWISTSVNKILFVWEDKNENRYKYY